jgi:hypothetical protein
VQAAGRISELTLAHGVPAARITCPTALIPAPGQYVLAHAAGSDAPLATIVFGGRRLVDGFECAPPVPASWTPGTRLNMRGPLGHGFVVPASAHRIALVAFDDELGRLLALVDIAKAQAASVTLVCNGPSEDLPLDLEIQPMPALAAVLDWADYSAFDASRESLPDIAKTLRSVGWPSPAGVAQILVRVPMPCGALAECGVCAVRLRTGTQLACEDGPVFDLTLLDFER